MAKSRRRDDDDDKPGKPMKPVARDGAYLMMLFVTLIAMIGGTVLLYFDYEQYGQNGEKAPKEVAPTIKTLGEVNKEAAAASP
jgi:hypothetical protein